jgi:glycosyltransferase involved in cell wall biosynthesis/ribosomal protein S18 acetylase RimI-like enzyme
MTVRIAHVATVDLTLRFLLLPQLRRLRDEGYDVAAISAPGPWVGDVEAEGIRHVPWRSATRSWDLRADVRAFRELVGILRRERFDLVHLHTPKAGVLGRVAAGLAGVPVVVNTVHGYYAVPGDAPRRRLPVVAVETVASRFADLELFQSQEDLAWARRSRIAPRGRTAFLGNGTDLVRFDPQAVDAAAARRELGIGEAALVVGTMGRLVEEKGYRELFAAMAQVRRRVPEALLLIAGEEDHTHADGLGLDELDRDGVVFTGWREDVETPLAAMDVFVLPSWREGVPRSAIEAAAMGLPLVLTDIRGCREVVRHGIEGLLVSVRDPGALAHAIERVLTDEPFRRRLGRAARARAVERFDERRVCDEVVASYRRLLAAKGIPSRWGFEGDVRIRRATRSDARALARLHAATMPSAFLPALGEGFLRELYRALATEPGAVTLVAEDDRWVVGLVAGTRSVAEFYRRFFRRHGVRAAVAAVPRLVRPSVARRAWETARYPRRGDGLPDAELLSIAVDAGARARGLGRRLTDELLRELAALGPNAVKVVVDADNDPANRLYEAAGFRRERQIQVHDGTSSNVWVIACRSSSPSGSPSS